MSPPPCSFPHTFLSLHSFSGLWYLHSLSDPPSSSPSFPPHPSYFPPLILTVCCLHLLEGPEDLHSWLPLSPSPVKCTGTLTESPLGSQNWDVFTERIQRGYGKETEALMSVWMVGRWITRTGDGSVGERRMLDFSLSNAFVSLLDTKHFHDSTPETSKDKPPWELSYFS